MVLDLPLVVVVADVTDLLGALAAPSAHLAVAVATTLLARMTVASVTMTAVTAPVVPKTVNVSATGMVSETVSPIVTSTAR